MIIVLFFVPIIIIFYYIHYSLFIKKKMYSALSRRQYSQEGRTVAIL